MTVKKQRLWLPSFLAVALATTGWLSPREASAAFHLWTIAEIYSNVDGSVQYIELSTTVNDQQFLSGHTLRVSVDGTPFQTFTFAGNSGSPTANRRLLLATPGYNALPGVPASDFTLSLNETCHCFFPIQGPGTTFTFNFGEGSDVVPVARSAIPTAGGTSLHRGAGTSMNEAISSPTNFAGATCALTCPEEGACTSENGGCVECAVPADCNDGNVCTDDACVNSRCVRTNNTASCNDGLFCTLTDVCSGGSCVGSGDRCPGEQCSEALDACVECVVNAHCPQDGLFCNGVERCVANACAPGLDPCPGQLCDEDLDACVECLIDDDCDDGNVCTDDVCNELGACVRTPNTEPCDDGRFCTAVDVCSAGLCVGTGSPCEEGENCNEGTDECADCLSAADCDDDDPCSVESCADGACGYADAADGTDCADGTFCDGVETCQAGACVAPGNPCDPVTERCVEAEAACVLLCGNGLLDAGEECDDGNGDDGDGCSSGCEIEAGWDCPEELGPPSQCTSTCGDGVKAVGAETCDDGGLEDGDGCDAECQLEAGWMCAPLSSDGPDVCDPVFGDGLVVGDEECDDGNLVAGDGCHEGAVEPGFVCDDSEPSVCVREGGGDEPGDGPGDVPPGDVGPDAGDVGVDADDQGDAPGDAGDVGGDVPSGGGEDSGCCRTAATGEAQNASWHLVVGAVWLVARRSRRARGGPRGSGRR
jgi:cysteine-rich repeat protein